MNAKNISLLFIILFIQTYNYTETNIKKQNHQQTQETNCYETYKLIKRFLEKYQRPFTMFDIAANQGYYSLRAAHDYKDSVFVMLEEEINGKQLFDICKHNTNLHNIVLLEKKINIDDLQRISECEHFDVILLSNFYNRYGNKWKDVLGKAYNMGDNVIVEVQKDKKSEIIDYLKTKGAKIIGTTTTSNLYLIEVYKKTIERVNWIFKKVRQKNSHIIHSDFAEKNLIKKTEEKIKISTWIPGINLVTFKMFHGIYPENKTIKNTIKNLNGSEHTDFVPNNIIIQGKEAALIDFDDKRPEYLKYSEKILQAILTFIDTPACDIRKYYVTMFLFKGYQNYFLF